MAGLSIRNLTITPLELKVVERLEADALPGRLANITSTISGLFNGTTTTTPAQTSAAPTSSHDVDGVLLPPFEARATDVGAPDAARREVLRLTFAEPGTPHRYTVDVAPAAASASSPSSTTGGGSVVMRKHDDGAPGEFTTVYVSSGSGSGAGAAARQDALRRRG